MILMDAFTRYSAELVQKNIYIVKGIIIQKN